MLIIRVRAPLNRKIYSNMEFQEIEADQNCTDVYYGKVECK